MRAEAALSPARSLWLVFVCTIVGPVLAGLLLSAFFSIMTIPAFFEGRFVTIQVVLRYLAAFTGTALYLGALPGFLTGLFLLFWQRNKGELSGRSFVSAAVGGATLAPFLSVVPMALEGQDNPLILVTRGSFVLWWPLTIPSAFVASFLLWSWRHRLGLRGMSVDA